MFRASRNKTHVGLRLTQQEADDLAHAAHAKNQSPGTFTKRAMLEKVYESPEVQTLLELRAMRDELLSRIQAQSQELQALRTELATFRKEFLQALPEN
jgi:hypothetical protein